MIDSQKRLLLRLSGASTLAVAAALAGCGKKEEAPNAAAPAAPAASVAAAAPSKAEPLKIAFAAAAWLVSPIAFAVGSAGVVWVLFMREFHSEALRLMRG